MSKVVSALLVAVLACVPAAAQKTEYPSLHELMDDVVARLPQGQVIVSGSLVVRNRKQQPVKTLKVDAQVHIGKASASGVYTLSNTNGVALERFKISSVAGAKTVYQYEKGNPLKPAAVPDLFASVQQTGVTWSDLTLPFLWWRDGRITGTGSVKGRDCFVAEVSPPPGEAGQPGARKLWIDRKYHMLIRAEEYGADGKVIRRLTVQSFKKIRDDWMIKDVVVEDMPTGYRSTLEIEDMHPPDEGR